jgi:hypothetical protein
MKLQFDPVPGRFLLTKGCAARIVKGKGAELLALLVASGTNRLVTADEVHALPGWQNMARESVGKQVARLIADLAHDGLLPFDYAHKTRAWRLSAGASAAVSDEMRSAVDAWLKARAWFPGARFAVVDPSAIAHWALAATKAHLAMTEGNAGIGLTELRKAYNESDHPDLMAISNLLATRIGQRLSTPHHPIPSDDSVGSVFEIAVEARRLATYAIRADSSGWKDQVSKLQAVLNRVVSSGDLTTQAYIHNAIALLLRRLGDPKTALQHIAEATPLAVFSGDITLVQSVLFNFGNILSDVRRERLLPTSEGLAIALIETDLVIRHRFGLGKDSAQAELLLAFLAYEEGMLDRAESYLGEARSIIAISRIAADEALEARVAGLLQLARDDRAGLASLELARSRFEAIGNLAAAEQVADELACAEQRFKPA